MDSTGSVRVKGSRFFFFEPLSPGLAGGRKPKIIMKKGDLTLYCYQVNVKVAFDFFHAARDAGHHFFMN